MKKINIITLLLSLNIAIYSQITPVLKVNDGNTGGHNGKCVQIGSENIANYAWYLSLGKGTGSPNWGAWGLEHWDDGLNFWKPAPTSNNGNYKFFLSDEGKVGVGIGNTPLWAKSLKWNWHALQIRGWAISDGWATYSDERLKTNFRTIQAPLQKIMALKAYQYDYDVPKYMSDTPTQTIYAANGMCNLEYAKYKKPATVFEDRGLYNRYGFKAQEVQSILPDIIHNPNSDTIGYKAMDYIGLIPILVEGIKAQQHMIDSQKLEIAQLRQEIVNWQGRSIDTIGQSKSRLFQNNPNPFDGTTNITYFIDETAAVSSATIEVRNIMGNLQSTITLSDGTGLGSVEYNGSNLTAGYYIYTLKINGSVKDSKMFLKEY